MQKKLQTFFIFSLLLIFISNVSGVSLCLEHAKHLSTKSVEKKHASDENNSTVSQDEKCQCKLHLQMNHSILPEIKEVVFFQTTLTNNEILQPKTTTYRCLLDYFSSRAPPILS